MDKTWTLKPSAHDVRDVVECVVWSKAPVVKVTGAQALVAATDAARLGFLRVKGDGLFEATQSGRGLLTEKDPVGYVMVLADIHASWKPKDDDLFRFNFLVRDSSTFFYVDPKSRLDGTS